ncbi:MAG TPA: serine protease [Acidimicrobiales bacterium]|nr:serine protease [Acidimicrobiales bacterium]
MASDYCALGSARLARTPSILGSVIGRLPVVLCMATAVLLGACGLVDEAASPNERSVSIQTTGCGHVSKTKGSGVAVGGDIVVTVAHLVIGASTVRVTIRDAGEHPGAIVALDTSTDLALILVPGLDVPPVDMADRWGGGRVLIVGGLRSGMVEAHIRRQVPVVIEEIGGQNRYQRDGYEVDAATGRGDSGAGLYEDNSLLGVVFATSTDEDRTTWVTSSAEITKLLAGGWESEYLCDKEASRVVRSD